MMFPLVAWLALSAPLPLVPSKAKPLSPVGEWTLEWRGGEGPARFDADGRFACFWQGQFWIGTWKMEDGILSVDEHIPAKDEWGGLRGNCKWAVVLKKGSLEGIVLPEGAFRLRKR